LTAVYGWFKSNLQDNKLSTYLVNPVIWSVEMSQMIRLDLKNPRTAVCGILLYQFQQFL